MIIFDTVGQYINSATELQDRINNIKQVMAQLRAHRLEMATNPNTVMFQSYETDTGQTKIKTTYRDINSINNALQVLEKELQMCYNQANGRVVRLMDVKNFNGNGRW